MPDTVARQMRIAAARADFLESGRPGAAGVPEVVAASWERSQAAGVDFARPQADFSEEFDPRSLLVRCATPVLAQLTTETVDLPLVIALTDGRARLLHRIDSSPTVGRLLDRVDFAPGFDYSESSMGTNGVGTVFEAGQSISVVGPEHFTENLQSFACAGAPIIDPITGRVAGVLDISSLAQTWSPIMHTLARSAAKDISRNLLMDRNQAQQALFETYLRVEAKHSRQCVFAFGDSVFIANASAQSLFDGEEQRTLREHATFLMGHRDRAVGTLELPSGRMVSIRGTRILAGSQVAGMVVIADSVASRSDGSPDDFTERLLPQIAVANQQTSRIVDDLYRPHESIAPGRSPAWLRAGNELRAALEAKRPAIVIGESGAGKFTLVAELFHALYPQARSILSDAAALGAEAEPSDISPLVAAPTEPTLHIVRNLDQATTDGVERLEGLFSAIEDVDGPAWVVATVSDTALDSDLPFHSLLGHFDVSVTVPPLRLRGDDLAAVTASLLRKLAPDRKVRISPQAERLIARYGWPRNVSQLRDALTFALRQRPVGEIQEADLPGYCQTTSRHSLTPLEAAERDAIVAALTAHEGNRVAAAAHLGMSRSSLYRKLKTYGITA